MISRSGCKPISSVFKLLEEEVKGKGKVKFYDPNCSQTNNSLDPSIISL